MAARLGMFLCPELLFGFASLNLVGLVRIKPKHPRLRIPARIASSLFVLFYGVLPVAIAILVGPAILLGRNEQAIAVGVGIACLAVTAAFIWRNLRAPQIDHEEFKRLEKAKRWRSLAVNFGAVLAILGCGALAWWWGHYSGLRALDKAAVEARAILAERQQGGSAEAAREWEALLDRLLADNQLAAVQQRAYLTEKTWPDGEALSKLVDARREFLTQLTKLSAGPAPVFKVRFDAFGAPILEKLSPGLRTAGLLLDLAAREAAARGDGARVMELLQTRLALGSRLVKLPTASGRGRARAISLPGSDTLGRVLPALAAAQREELAAYDLKLASLRRAVPADVAAGTVEDVAVWLVWFQKLVTGGDDTRPADEHSISKFARRFVLPLYGEHLAGNALPRARREASLAMEPLSPSKVDAEISEPEPASSPLFLGLWFWTLSSGPASVIHRSINSQPRLGAYEAACALRLYALDKGKYPVALADLAPQYVKPDLLDPAGPVRLDYQPTGPGFRLTWKSWRETAAGFQPAGEESEIAVGVPPTPPEKLRKH